MTVLPINRVLQRIREGKSVRDARSPSLPAKKESALTPQQLEVIRSLIRGWRPQKDYFGPRPNLGALENVMRIVVGTGTGTGTRTRTGTGMVGSLRCADHRFVTA